MKINFSLNRETCAFKKDIKLGFETALELTEVSKNISVNIALVSAKEIKEILIKKEVVDPDDVEMLQDLVLTAINEALRKADDMMQDGLEGFNIPGLF